MQEKINNFFKKMKKIPEYLNKFSDLFFDWFKKYGWLVVMLLAIIFSMIAKSTFLDNVSGDYEGFLKHWIAFYCENGLKGLGTPLGDYTPFYNYFLAIISLFKGNDLHLIKYLSIVFDFVMAFGFFFILKLLFNKNIATIGFSVALILPCVVINGAIWGQCDVIFTSFLVWSFYFLLKEKYDKVMIFFSIAFAIKLQAVFFLPFLFLLILKRKIKVYYLLYIPFIYILMALPSIIAGRNFFEILTIYFRQAGQYLDLSLLAPSLYALIDNNLAHDLSKLFGVGGVFACLIITMVYIFYFYYKDFKFNKENLITLALISSLVTPYLLPYMHERYFFVADIFSILYVFIKKKGFVIALLINFASFICCYAYITGQNILWNNINYVRVGSLINLSAILLLIREVKNDFFKISA